MLKWIVNYILGRSKTMEAINVAPVNTNLVISLERYLTSDNKYPDRALSSELIEEYKVNAINLLNKVNGLLNELNIMNVKISSGFRTTNANSEANGTKKSNHLKCLAIDLVDEDGQLDKMFMNNLKLLEKYGLYLESPGHTHKWSHLQCVSPKSENRVFIP